MTAPLYDALLRFAAETPLRMAMPGHKGKPVHPLGTAFSRLDFTELPPTGNLYAPGGPIEEAEALWAKWWDMDCCLFLTGGSTQGILAALLCVTRPGDLVLTDRMSHRSIHNAFALFDLRPRWLERPWLSEAGVLGPLDPETVDSALSREDTVKTVCITSPSYYGVLSDIPAIARVCHAHGARLVVDAAHGAHLPFFVPGVYAEADLVVTSAHKTLCAPGQSALLFGRRGITLEDLRRASMMVATSSPSYPMMAALDCAQEHYFLRSGDKAYHAAAHAVSELRQNYPSLTDTDTPLDPTRFTLCAEDGFAVEAALQGMGIYPEMADRSHVVFIVTDCDTSEDFQRLRRGLDALGLRNQRRIPCPLPHPLPLPEQSLTPRQAVFAPRRDCPWSEAAGAVAAEQLSPYPPGVPVIAPGERIQKKTLAYLEQMGYNKTTIAVVAARD